MSQTPYRVLVVGSWHLGSVVGVGIASVGHQVTLWDQSTRVATEWKKGRPPIHEPGLEELARPRFQENLFWADDLPQAVSKADWIVLAYDTPINEQDEVILDSVTEGLETVLKTEVADHANFFFTSQLPVGTSRKLRGEIKKRFPNWKGHVLYQPENLRLGSALESLKNPDRVALGFDTADTATQDKLEQEFRKLFGLETTPVDRLNLESAEMVKHALNAYLATCVVFGNELSEICEKTGANAWEVAKSLKKDSRVGKKAPLFPGLAFAGGTLARDIKTLSHFETSSGNLFQTLYQSNENRNRWVISKLKEELGTLQNKTILLLGVTYKAGTSTVRRSPSIQIAGLLKEAGAQCVAIDPMADLTELSAKEREALPFTLHRTPENLFEKSDAAVLVTEWPEFAGWDWGKLKTKSSTLIDSKNFLSSAENTHWTRIVPGIAKEIV